MKNMLDVFELGGGTLALSNEGSEVCQSVPKLPSIGPPTAGILLPSSVLCTSVNDCANSKFISQINFIFIFASCFLCIRILLKLFCFTILYSFTLINIFLNTFR
jgi:hypothetical protein